MAMGNGSLSGLVPDAEGIDVVPPLVDDPIPIGIVAKKSWTRSKGTYYGVDGWHVKRLGMIFIPILVIFVILGIV